MGWPYDLDVVGRLHDHKIDGGYRMKNGKTSRVMHNHILLEKEEGTLRLFNVLV